MSPDFYKDSRTHLNVLCNTLQSLYEGTLLKKDKTPYKKLILQMPPQHGKTRTMIHFCQWVFGRDNSQRIIVGSYNDDTASDFSRYTRDGITEEKFDPGAMVYSDVFPETQIKRGNSSYQKWALEGQHFNYLGAGIGGSLTSKGATILVVDDPIKGAIEALNESHLEKVWIWYTSTFLSRVSAEGGEPLEIIIMTPWAKLDPVGRILDSEDAKDWYVLSMPAIEKGKMLCSELLGKARYLFLQRTQVPEVFAANYDLKRVDVEGRLYKDIKTYTELPQDENGRSLIREIKNYTDVADEGRDYLCSINYGVYKGSIYILDVYYTNKGAETTESKTAKMFADGGVRLADIESNNGGRFFARNVKRILNEDLKHFSTVVKWFHQSDNKMARIVSNSATVQENVYFPVNWRDRWPEFYKAVTSFLKDGKNKYDDGPDALTGCVEKSLVKRKIQFA